MEDTSIPVLVVVGDASRAEGLVAELNQAGLAARKAKSANEAILLTMDIQFGAVIVDFELPTESGLTVLQHFMSYDRVIPVILLASGREDPQWPRLAFEGGADDVVPQTTPPSEVLWRLRRRLAAAARVSALQAERDALKSLAITDGLTQLANHRAFQERLREEFRRAQRYDDPMACIVMDVDHFKAVNDTHGHQTGDEVLQHVAKGIRSAVRETDYCARYGGDEFGVLLPKTHLAGALTVAERMSQALKAIRAGVDGAIRVTASFGVSGFPGRSVTTADQLLKTADDALYRSKKEGRNKISLFQSSLYVARNG
jgi:diguanylate cyclase (GGDEF)-like protein